MPCDHRQPGPAAHANPSRQVTVLQRSGGTCGPQFIRLITQAGLLAGRALEIPAKRAYDGTALARPSGSRHQGGLKPMVKFEISTHINRPLAEVFKYMADPTKQPEWNSIVEEAVPSETPIRMGTKIQTRARFLGRKMESTAEVTEYELNKRVEQKRVKSFHLTITNMLDTHCAGST